MLNLAVDWGHLNSNPAMRVKHFPEKDTPKERILTKEEENLLLEAAAKDLKPILVIALNTGMRRGEILNMRWDQIDLERNQIHVEFTKSGKSRIIPINSELSVSLKQLKKTRDSSVVFLLIYTIPIVFMSKVANPKKLKKPTTSVTVVKIIDED